LDDVLLGEHRRRGHRDGSNVRRGGLLDLREVVVEEFDRLGRLLGDGGSRGGAGTTLDGRRNAGNRIFGRDAGAGVGSSSSSRSRSRSRNRGIGRSRSVRRLGSFLALLALARAGVIAALLGLRRVRNRSGGSGT
jgi:hypothetical protein